jgi:hypothetical protein
MWFIIDSTPSLASSAFTIITHHQCWFLLFHIHHLFCRSRQIQIWKNYVVVTVLTFGACAVLGCTQYLQIQLDAIIKVQPIWIVIAQALVAMGTGIIIEVQRFLFHKSAEYMVGTVAFPPLPFATPISLILPPPPPLPFFFPLLISTLSMPQHVVPRPIAPDLPIYLRR